jgi:hypothetical protein
VRLAAIESPPLTTVGPDDARSRAGLAARPHSKGSCSTVRLSQGRCSPTAMAD